MKYFKSPIFYMGNKYKILPKIEPLFPKNINIFIDPFAGSGTVCVNAKADFIIYNELNPNIAHLFNMFFIYTPKEIDEAIKGYIKEYNLNTEGIDVKPGNPLVKETREFYNNNYIKFRKAYNESDRPILMLFTLIHYSFSNLIRFNSKSDLNIPFGYRCYKECHRRQIEDWFNLLKEKRIATYEGNGFDILENYNKIKETYHPYNKNNFIYIDPPYSNTTAIYNEPRAFGGWSIQDDLRLFKDLEDLDKMGVKWGLNNVFENRGIRNNHLIEWCNKNNWNVIHLNHEYSALGKGNAKSDEVYICNYEIEE